MIKLILVSHGSFAAGLREAAEMILGEQEELSVFGIFPGDTLESFSAKIERAIQMYGEPENTLILSDLPCGTPSNAATMMAMKYQVHAVSGCNLPLLIEVLSMRDEAGIEEVVQKAYEEGRKGIIDVKTMIKERGQNT